MGRKAHNSTCSKSGEEEPCIMTNVSTEEIFLFYSGARRMGFIGGRVKFLKVQEEQLCGEHPEWRRYSVLKEVCLGNKNSNTFKQKLPVNCQEVGLYI